MEIISNSACIRTALFDKNTTFAYESSPLSDTISKELKRRGMKFVGTTLVYSFLQAIGIINSHEENCWLYED